MAGSFRRQAEAKLADLTEKASDSGLSQVEIFSQAFDEIDQKWDRFHQDYEEFRQQESAQEAPGEEKPISSASLASSRMGQLVVQFSEIVTAVRALPSSELTRPVAETLAAAVENEDLALRTLRDLVKQEDALTPQPTPTSEAEATPEQAPLAEAVPSRFIDFETRLVDSNGLRHLAAQDLADILTASISETSEETQVAAKALANGFEPLAKSWDLFHKDYDAWRLTEGGCVRGEAIKMLSSFVTRFGTLTSKVRALPRATPLRPLGELLIEAAEREEQALGQLRNSWKPFDANVYQSFDQARNEANKLRRQVVAGLNDLLSQ